jgi:hypothetical protein
MAPKLPESGAKKGLRALTTCSPLWHFGFQSSAEEKEKFGDKVNGICQKRR